MMSITQTEALLFDPHAAWETSLHHRCTGKFTAGAGMRLALSLS